jgi:predicted XRE-type DNA-binding protein
MISSNARIEIARFAVVRGDGECWPFKMKSTVRGYGRIKRGGVTLGAHRFAYELATGQRLTVDQWACHHCDNPGCCNPSHIYAGNATSNNRDTVIRERRRDARGERSPHARISDADAEKIFALAQARDLSQAAIGRRFGISQSAVSLIKRRKIRSVQLGGTPSSRFLHHG